VEPACFQKGEASVNFVGKVG